MIAPALSPLAFATGLAQEVGASLRVYFRQGHLKTQTKPDHSLVTEADTATDRAIATAIRAAYPNDALLSEEIQPRLEAPAQAVWIVDPLDGTTNFSLGMQTWGTLIARVVDGWPELAVLYFPLLEELYTAQRGQGAQLNGQPLRVRVPDAAHPTAFFACCSRTFRRYQVSLPYKPRILGSAGYDLCCVARGAAAMGVEALPKIWDLAGAWLLVEEAGGVVETLDGSRPFPLQPGLAYDRLSFPVLFAASPELAAEVRKNLQPRPNGPPPG